MTGPWIKLWRDVLNKKIGFLMRRYGHEVLTFWIGVLTNSEDGVLEIDEDMLADLCLLETKRYEEIRSIFVDRRLIGVDEDGRILVLNWEEYQSGPGESSSTERVRRFRERRRTPITPATPSPSPAPVHETDETFHETQDETLETLHETEEGEEEGEKEGEEERAGAREDPPPLGSHAGIAYAWFKRFSKETGILIGPQPADILKARDLLERLGGDEQVIHRAIDAYFTGWRGFWWAVNKSTRKLSPDQVAPDFSFFGFVDHITEIISGLSAPQAPPKVELIKDIVCPVCREIISGKVSMVTCSVCHFDLGDRDNPAAVEEHRAFLSNLEEFRAPESGELMSRIIGDRIAG